MNKISATFETLIHQLSRRKKQAIAVLVDFVALPVALWTALALHLSGFFSSFLSGYAADRFGAPKVLLGFAVVGALLSAAIGWLGDITVP